MSDVWDTSLNQFDWSGLEFGDMVEIRIDVDVTTTANNQYVEIDLFLGMGAGEYLIPFTSTTTKLSGTSKTNIYNGIFIGDGNTRDNPAELMIKSDSLATVVVNGWYVKITKRV